jgi:hypothetical protein
MLSSLPPTTTTGSADGHAATSSGGDDGGDNLPSQLQRDSSAKAGSKSVPPWIDRRS